MKLLSDILVGQTFTADLGDGHVKAFQRLSREAAAGHVAVVRLADGAYYELLDVSSVQEVALKVVPE